MEQQTDIRWIQRYANYHKACTRLLDVTEADRFMDDLSELDLELLYSVDLLDYQKKKGTAIGEHIDRVGQVFYAIP